MVSLTATSENNSRNFINLPLFIREQDFIVKDLTTDSEKIQAYCLRHRIFCQELGWMPQRENGQERDGYDYKAVFLGVYDRRRRLLAFLRLIMPQTTFMLEREFSRLVGPEHKIRKEDDTVEVSRLCVAPEARNCKFSGHFDSQGISSESISMLLYKGAYRWCVRKDIRYLYFVVEQKIYKLLHLKGFPCKIIGRPKTMPDGEIAMAAIMDWREFEILNEIKRPKALEWFTQYRSTLIFINQY
jgi:N-acyl amino acid synthase of PEP-CTERM/exosortase system